MPKLSIITINYNNKEGLLKTVKSVVGQLSSEVEFIVIDGGSSDGSKDVLDEFSAYFTFAVSEKDSGIYNAMNKGIKASKGEYLLFLNSGDWLHNDKVLSNVLPLLNEEDVISGDIDIFDNGRWHHMQSDDTVSVGLFLEKSLYHQATFIRKDLFDEFGLYDEQFSIGGDHEFFIRTLFKNAATYKHIPLVISDFPANGISNDQKFIITNRKERDMAWKKHFTDHIINELKNYHAITSSRRHYYSQRIAHRLKKVRSIFG